jgi:hypothetical protein
VGSAWSAWSAEYNITMINSSLDARQGFYRKYSALGVELGVRSRRTGPGILNLSCVFRFTGRDQHQSATTIHASLQNHNDTRGPHSNPAAFAGFVGLMLGRTKANAAKVRTYRKFNRDKFFSKVADIPTPKKLAKLFPITDTFIGDDDLGSTADAFDALTRMGVNIPTGATPPDWSGRMIGGFPAWGVPGEMRKGAGGHTVACYTPNSSCSLHDYCTTNATDSQLVNATDLKLQAEAAFPCQTNASSDACLTPGAMPLTPHGQHSRVVMSAMADEPGWDAMTSIPTKTSGVVRRRWHSYLQEQGLTPHDFGATAWGDVVPDTGRGDAGAGNTSTAGNPLKLPARKLFYWSIRFAHWDSCRYMAEWSAALQLASGDPSLQTYVNWNNFDGRMYVPGTLAIRPLTQRGWHMTVRENGTFLNHFLMFVPSLS